VCSFFSDLLVIPPDARPTCRAHIRALQTFVIETHSPHKGSTAAKAGTPGGWNLALFLHEMSDSMGSISTLAALHARSSLGRQLREGGLICKYVFDLKGLPHFHSPLH
jgi:hypothetical protein